MIIHKPKNGVPLSVSHLNDAIYNNKNGIPFWEKPLFKHPANSESNEV